MEKPSVVVKVCPNEKSEQLYQMLLRSQVGCASESTTTPSNVAVIVAPHRNSFDGVMDVIRE